MSDLTANYDASLRGDREAFGKIVREHQNMVCAVTFSITGNLQQSEDIAQETFITAWLKLKELKDPTKFPAWLCGIARNLAHNAVRKLSREHAAIPRTENASKHLPETLPERDAEPSDRVAKAAIVWAILEEIPETYREPLVMYYQQSRSIPEIAAALDLTEENVRQRLSRGRAQLRSEVAQRVESALEFLRPDDKFTLFVLAALPVSILTASQAIATVTGTAAVGTAAGTTAGAGAAGTTGTGGILGIIATVFIYGFWIIFWPALMIFSFLMNYAQFRDMPTVRSRRARLKYYSLFIGSLFLVLELMTLLFLLPLGIIPRSYMDVYAGLYMFFPILGMIAGQYIEVKMRRILEEELGYRPMPDIPLEHSPFSMKKLEKTVRFQLITTSVFVLPYGLFCLPLWFLLYPFSLIGAIVACLLTLLIPGIGIYYFAKLKRLYLFMATEEGMLKYPPQKTYTVFKISPMIRRWYDKQKGEDPLKLKDYLFSSFPGGIFTMILLTGCHGTNATISQILLAVSPLLLIPPCLLGLMRKSSKPRENAGGLSVFLILWVVLMMETVLFEPLSQRFGAAFVHRYTLMFAIIGIVASVSWIFFKRTPKQT